jgi:hypothetical protein
MAVIGQKPTSEVAMLHPEIDAELTLLPPAQGGREAPIRGEYRGVFTVAADKAYSMRLEIPAESPLSAEHPTTVGVQFLHPKDALPHFKVGTVFSMWEGRAIGHGRVVSVR